MAEKAFLRRMAGLLQSAPWIASVAMRLWRWRQARYSVGVAGVVFNEDEQVLLVEHVFHPQTPWGLPGGWVERREDPAAALCREMQEELELEVAVGAVLLVEHEHAGHLDLAYLCVAKGRIGRLSRELLDHGWYDIADLPGLHRFHHRAIMRALQMVSGVAE